MAEPLRGGSWSVTEKLLYSMAWMLSLKVKIIPFYAKIDFFFFPDLVMGYLE